MRFHMVHVCFFGQNRGDVLRSFYSTVEGAMKLKFAHYTPLEMRFHMVSFLDKVKIFRFWPKTMDYNIITYHVSSSFELATRA